jgi:hypothetical protein
VGDNYVETLPKGAHLPPDRTFLPNNPEYNAAKATGIEHSQGLTNDEINDTFVGATSRDVNLGFGKPGDMSKAERSAFGDGGGKKTGAGLVQYGEGENLAQDKNKKYEPGKDYVGNSREEKQYRWQEGDKGSTSGNRGPSARTD